MKTILVFGSSVTWEAWDKELGGWVNRLKLYFWKEYEEIDVYNLGISGENTKCLAERLETEISARNEGELILIFSVGDNDSAKDSSVGVELEDFKKNIEQIIKISKKFTRYIIFLGTKRVDESKTNPVPWDKTVYYKNKNLEDYSYEIESFCKEKKIRFLPLVGLLKKEDFEDGIHPNSRGHEKVFQEVKDFLEGNHLLK